MKNTERLADDALQAWIINPMKNNNARYALFGADGQYHGSFPDESLARGRVDEVAETEAWIGDGFQIVKFR